jgi:hypothetical protein
MELAVSTLKNNQFPVYNTHVMLCIIVIHINGCLSCPDLSVCAHCVVVCCLRVDHSICSSCSISLYTAVTNFVPSMASVKHIKMLLHSKVMGQSIYIETSIRNKCQCSFYCALLYTTCFGPYWWPSSGGL